MASIFDEVEDAVGKTVDVIPDVPDVDLPEPPDVDLPDPPDVDLPDLPDLPNLSDLPASTRPCRTATARL